MEGVIAADQTDVDRVDQLLLIPTELEAAMVRPQLRLEELGLQRHVRVELCGCGPFLSGARTMQLVQQFQPRSVLLLGIAGRIPPLEGSKQRAATSAVVDNAPNETSGAKIAANGSVPLVGNVGRWPEMPPLEIGNAYEFTQVVCHGFGAGSGAGYRSAWELGWDRWPAPDDLLLVERLPLQPLTDGSSPALPSRLLLCSATASADSGEVALRLSSAPDAVAEDMESYSVAIACRLAGLPLRVIRGISNQAGNRQHADWRVAEALEAAVALWHGNR